MNEKLKSDYCLPMQGLILQRLRINNAISLKVARSEILQPDGGYLGCFLETISIFSIDELNILIGKNYKTESAIELANILIYELISDNIKAEDCNNRIVNSKDLTHPTSVEHPSAHG